MAVFDVGRVCMKIAGRDARKKCVVVEVIDSIYVTIDGETRRRKCNIAHLEPLDVVVDILSGADNVAVVKAMRAEGFVCEEKKESQKQVQLRPKKQKIVKKKEKPAKQMTIHKQEATKEETVAPERKMASKKKSASEKKDVSKKKSASGKKASMVEDTKNQAESKE